MCVFFCQFVADAYFQAVPKVVIENSGSAAAGDQLLPLSASGAGEISNDVSQRSTLDTMSEASGAVERSHSDDCLWGGACNRSDCKSNRRWNMKNSKNQVQNEEKVSSSSSSSTTNESTSSSSGGVPVSYIHSARVSSSHLHSEAESGSSSSMLNPTASSSGQNLNRKPQTSSTSRENPIASSSQSPAYESSSDKNNSLNQSQGSSANNHGRLDALARRMHMDAVASSSSSKETLLKSSRIPSASSEMPMDNNSSCAVGSRERPGIFSGNSSFSFMSEDSSVSWVMPGLSDTIINPSNPSPSDSSNLSSPGKENFSSSYGKGDHSTSMVQEGLSASTNMETDSRQEPVSSSSEQLMETSDFIRSFEGWSQRKRGTESNHPLEKIPSPNSRKSK